MYQGLEAEIKWNGPGGRSVDYPSVATDAEGIVSIVGPCADVALIALEQGGGGGITIIPNLLGQHNHGLFQMQRQAHSTSDKHEKSSQASEQ